MKAGRIGILTGGGDVPGLNSVIKTVVYRASDAGRQVTGIRRGWEGLTHVNFDDPASVSRYVLPLDRQNTRTIDRTGGHLAAQLAHQSAQDEEGAGVPARRDFSVGGKHQGRRDIDRLRHDVRRC